MARFLLAAFLVVVALSVWRSFRRRARRRDMAAARAAGLLPVPMTLQRDKVTGIYRPVDAFD